MAVAKAPAVSLFTRPAQTSERPAQKVSGAYTLAQASFVFPPQAAPSEGSKSSTAGTVACTSSATYA